jgi:hypothetical protein
MTREVAARAVQRTLRGRLTGGLAAATASLLLAILLLELWSADFGVPLHDGTDVPYTRMLVQEIEETGGFFRNPRLGAPLGQELRDYPEVDPISFVLLRVLTLFTSDPDVALNVFYLLTFPLIALVTYGVLRRRVGSGPAFVAAVLYTLLPYHFDRGESHLFLAAYWAVPLACHLILVLLTGEPAFERRARDARGLLGWASRRSLLTVGACLVVGSTWFYYAAYSLILLAAVGVLALLARPSKPTLAQGAAVIGLTGFFLLLNLAPYLVHRADSGPNTFYAVRGPQESEQFALKLMQLALPIEDHRIDRLGRFSRHYAETATNQHIDEYPATHLGAAGALGLAWLLLVAGAALLPGRGQALARGYGPAAAGALVVFLFATVGGLGSAFAYTLHATELRQWNRLSIFIAFFALLAVALALEGVGGRLRGRRAGSGFALLLTAVLALGVLDQTGSPPDYDALAAADERDASFVARVEGSLPRGAAVFQLPYVTFPETTPRPGIPYFDQLRGYLHSESLRWSYGDVTGQAKEWRDDLVGQSLEEVLRAASAAGFAGIEVSRRAYDDRAAALEAKLRPRLGVNPLVSDDGTRSFWDLRPYARRLRGRLGTEGVARLRERVLAPGPSFTPSSPLRGGEADP